ncbi:MAG: histidine kinase [Bacteroidetes bacterium]|nr:histidine kinase [Bacteroidota bacterium]
MNRPIQQIFLHLIGCVVFLSLPLLFSPESLSLSDYLTNPPTQRDLITYILLLGVFYSNFYWLIPRLYFQHKYFLYILINIVCFFLITAIPAYLIHRPFRPGPGFPPMPPPQMIAPTKTIAPPHTRFFFDFNQHLFLFLGVLFLALLLKVRARLKQAEAEKLHAELAYLKAQVNPHFLFNTLNSIYSLALEKSDSTADAVVKLSSMMRYVLLETSRDKVALEQEISYISDYIDLQQIRFEGSSKVDFSVTGQPAGKSIIPLLLIPFVENAFKYGVNPEEPSVIHIHIILSDNQLRLDVRNKKVARPQPTPISSGLGIQNTKQRLQLLYPGRHTLQIDDKDVDFSVSLTLKLT